MPIGRGASFPATRTAAMMLVALALMGADWYGDDYGQCRGTTAATVQCLDGLTAGWQARLESAYEKLLAAQDVPERKATLEDAQRLWREYRQASCTFFRQGPGSIAAIEAAECMRVLTRQRAVELEQITGQAGQ